MKFCLTLFISCLLPILAIQASPHFNDREINKTLEKEAKKFNQQKLMTSEEDIMSQLWQESKLKLNLEDSSKQGGEFNYQSSLDSIVIVARAYKCNNCDDLHISASSGFIIHESGVIATNYHVMEKYDKYGMFIMTYDQKTYPIKKVLASDKNADIALIKIEGESFPALELKANEPVGNAVTAITHPSNHFYTLTKGYISRYLQYKFKNKEVPFVQITADYAKGSSGGPILNEQGQVVAMVCLTKSVYYTKKDNLQMVFKYCVPSQSILNLIE